MLVVNCYMIVTIKYLYQGQIIKQNREIIEDLDVILQMYHL